MTNTLTYGVRYLLNQAVQVDVVAGRTAALAAASDVYYEHGIVAEIVSRSAAGWVVDEKATIKFKRELVEETIDDLAQEEINAAQAADFLRYLPSGLLTDEQVEACRRDGFHIADECRLATWIERAVNIYMECQKSAQDRDRGNNDETLGIEYDRHLDVLAGVIDHGGNIDYDCPSCARIITVKAVA